MWMEAVGTRENEKANYARHFQNQRRFSPCHFRLEAALIVASS